MIRHHHRRIGVGIESENDERPEETADSREKEDLDEMDEEDQEAEGSFSDQFPNSVTTVSKDELEN